MAATDIIARLRLNAEQFSAETKKQLGDFETRANSTSAKIAGAFGGIGKIGGGLLAGIGVAELARVGKSSLEYADSLSTIADQADINVERYQTLREATRQLEIDSDSFDQALKRLQQTLGDVQNGVDNGATKALDRMGVSQRILSGEITTADGLLDAIAVSSNKYATAAQFTGEAVDIFGRKVGVDMAAALRDGGAALHEAEAQFRQTGRVISEEYVKGLADANEKIDKFYANLQVTTTIWAGNTITAVQQTMNKWQDYLAVLGIVDARKPPQLDAPGRAAVANLQTVKLDQRIAALEKDLAAARFTKPDSVMGADGRVRALELQISQLRQQRAGLQKTVWAGIGWGDDPTKGVIDRALNPPTMPADGTAAKSAGGAASRRAAIKAEQAALFDLSKSYGVIATDVQRVGQELAKAFEDGPSAHDLIAANDQRRAGEERLAAALRQIEKEEAERGREQIRELAGFYLDAFEGSGGSIWKQFESAGKEAIAVLAAQFTLSMITGQKFDFGSALGSLGATTGNPLLSGLGQLGQLGSLAGSIGKIGGLFGGASAAGGIAGGISSAAGTGIAAAQGALASAGGAAGAAGAAGGLAGVSSALSAAAPYAAIAAIALPLVTGLFKKHKIGSANLTGVGEDDLSLSGNSGSRKSTAKGLAGDVVSGLERIAESLGAELGSFRTSIGVSGDSFHVDTTGQGKLRKSQGGLDFDNDQGAAIAAAIQDAIDDGVIKGVSDAAQRILRSGQDLEKAIEKAVLIESIPKMLKERLDPAGAALDAVSDRWAKTVAVLREGGASAQQMAEAQQLYNIELDEARERSGAAASTLRDFRDSLTIGGDSPLSLRAQKAAAEQAIAPYLDKINAGQSIDQDKYTEAAQRYLDIERQMSGSTGAYFAEFDRIQAATNKAISTIDNAAPIRTASDPFAEKTATYTKVTADIVSDLPPLMKENNALLGEMIGLLKQRAEFIGTLRSN